MERGIFSGSHQFEMGGEVPAIGINSLELNRKWGSYATNGDYINSHWDFSVIS